MRNYSRLNMNLGVIHMLPLCVCACECVCACLFEVRKQPGQTACVFVCPQEVWLLSRERELKEDLRRERDKEIELAIWTLEEETSKDKEECERAADNRCVCVWIDSTVTPTSDVFPFTL